MKKMKPELLQKWYTRVIGVFFVFITVILVLDYAKMGFRPETMHKLFHIIIGVIVLRFGWNSKKFWRLFCLINGAFFTYFAAVGWIFPNLGGLKAFGFADTVLHSIVGVSGLVIGLQRKRK